MMVDLMQDYFEKIGAKPCCFEDLHSHLQLGSVVLARWTTYLNSVSRSFVSFAVSQLKGVWLSLRQTQDGIQRIINIHKLLRYNLSQQDVSAEAEISNALLYFK